MPQPWPGVPFGYISRQQSTREYLVTHPQQLLRRHLSFAGWTGGWVGEGSVFSHLFDRVILQSQVPGEMKSIVTDLKNLLKKHRVSLGQILIPGDRAFKAFQVHFWQSFCSLMLNYYHTSFLLSTLPTSSLRYLSGNICEHLRRLLWSLLELVAPSSVIVLEYTVVQIILCYCPLCTEVSTLIETVRSLRAGSKYYPS